MNAPPRPVANDSLIIAAVKDIGERLDIEPEDIADVFRPYMDGYQIARALETHHSYDLDLSDAEELDGCATAVQEALRKEQRVWAELWHVQPPFTVGSHVTGGGVTGVIAGISDHFPASYKIKEDGCASEGRFVIVEFEEVRLTEQAPA